MSEVIQELKKIIKNKIKIEKISIKELASLVGNKEKTVRNYLSGNSKLSIEFVKTVKLKLKFDKYEMEKIDEFIYHNRLKKEKNNFEGERISYVSELLLLKTLVEENRKIRKELEEKEELLNTYKNSNNYIQASYNDRLKINAFKSDFDTTTKIIPLLWKLRDDSSKVFSELELLLEINNEQENKKMSIGLNKVGKDLIEMGEKIIKYSQNKEIIDLGE